MRKIILVSFIFCFTFFSLWSASKQNAELNKVDLINLDLSTWNQDRTDYYLFYYSPPSATYYYWICPDQYGDDEFGVRYTAPFDCNLTTYNAAFYQYVGNPTGITIHVYDSIAETPNTELGSLSIPLANMNIGTTVDLYVNSFDLSSLGLSFSEGDDFFITYSVDDGIYPTDMISCLSDDSDLASGVNRSGEFWSGSWGYMVDDWGLGVEFLMEAVVEPIQPYIEIGAGTTTNYYIPFYGNYDYGWSRVIYLQSEIGAAMNIGTLSYNVSSSPSNYETINQKIYMKHTSDSTFTSGAYEDNSTYTLVYDGPITWNGSGWHDIQLDTSFNYNGVDNLVIYYQNQDGSYSSGYPYFYYTSQSNRAIYKYQDSTFPTTSGTLTYRAPNIRLHKVVEANPPDEPSNPTPSDLAFEVPISGSLTWDFGANSETYDLWFGPAGDLERVVSGETAGSSGSYSYSGIAYSTSYEWQIVVYNSNREYIMGPIWSFFTECGEISTFPWEEGFEVDTWIGDPAAPPCWKQITVSGTNTWERYSFSTHTGSYCARGPWTSAGGEHLLITPGLDLSADDYILKFWLDGSTLSGTDLKIQIGDDNSAAGSFTTDLAYFIAGTNMPGTYEEITIDLSAYSGVKYIAFRMIDDNGYSVYIDDISVEIAPSCPVPTDLVQSNITTIGADLSWTSTASLFDLYIVPTGDPAPEAGTTPTVVGTGDNPYTWLGGTASTTYDWYVRADCGARETSPWSGPATFTTACEAVALPMFEDADGVTPPELPACWSQINDTGNSYAIVKTYNSSSYSVPNCFYMYNSYATTGNLILISPESTHDSEGTWVKFWAKCSSGVQNLLVGTITDPADPATFTTVETVEINSTYQEYMVVLSGTDNHIAFKHAMDGTYDYNYIDDILWEELPSCVPPMLLYAENFTQNSATLGWTQYGSAESWNIELGYPGFNPGSGEEELAFTEILENPYEVTGLTPGTTYDFYVQADCGESRSRELTEWSGPVTFNTMQATVGIPYYENFEADAGGYIHAGNNDCWEYGTPTSGPAVAFSGENCWATVLDGNYTYTGQGFLYSPYIDLTTAVEPILNYYHWYNFENNYDGVNVKVSTDYGTTWQLITPTSGYTHTSVYYLDDVNLNEPGWSGDGSALGWHKVSFDLTAYIGNVVWIKWTFGADSVVRPGYYMDDVKVHEPAPTIELSAGSLDFGAWQVGQTAVLPLIISNPASAPVALQIQSITTSNPVFTIESARVDNIAPGSSLTYNVSFSPAAITDYNEHITIVSNDPFTLPPFGNGLTVPLTGSGIEPYSILGDLPSNVDLYIPASTTGGIDIEITNEGVAPLDLYDIQMLTREFVVTPNEILDIPFEGSEMINLSYIAGADNNIEEGTIGFTTNEPPLPPGEYFNVWPPPGWDLTGGSHNWLQMLYDSNYSARANFWSWSYGSDAYLTSPAVDLTGISSAELVFKWSHKYHTSYPNDALTVLISNDGSSWTQVWYETGSTFDSNDGAGNTVPGSFTEETISIPGSFLGGDFYIQFYAYSGWGPDLFIDDVRIESDSRDLLNPEPWTYNIPVTAYTVEPYDLSDPESGYRVLNELAGSGSRETDVPEYNWYDNIAPENFVPNTVDPVELEHNFKYFDQDIISLNIYNNGATAWPILLLNTDSEARTKNIEHTVSANQPEQEIKKPGVPIAVEGHPRADNEIYMQGIIWTYTEAYFTSDEEKTVVTFYYPGLLEVQIVLYASGQVNFQWKHFDTFLWFNYASSFWGAGLYGGIDPADYAVVFDDEDWVYPNYSPESAVGFYPGFDDTALLPEEIIFNEDTVYYLDVSQYIPTGGEVLNIEMTDSEHITTVLDGNIIEFHPDLNFYDEAGEILGYTISAPVRSTGEILAKVLPVNDPPVVINPLEDLELPEDFEPPHVIDLSNVFEDVDSDLAFSLTVDDPSKVDAEIVGTDLVLTSILNEFTTTPILITLTAEEILRGADVGKTNVSLNTKSGANTRAAVTSSFYLTITPVNDAPIVIAPIADKSIPEDTSTQVDLNEVFFDVDGDVLTFDYQLETDSHFDATLVGGVLTITPEADWNGSETVIVTADDGVTERNTGIANLSARSRDTVQDEFLVEVTYVNDAPVVVTPIADFAMDEDTEDSSIDLNTVFDDVDIIYSDELTYSVSGNTHMAVDIVDGIVTLVPEADWNGPQILTFRATDTYFAYVEDVVNVQVLPVNDAPTINLPDSFDFNEGGTLVVNFNQYVNDIDGDVLTLTVEGNEDVTVSIVNLQVTFGTAYPQYFGAETFTFTVDDGGGEEAARYVASDDVVVNVHYVNDAPVYVGPVYVNQPEDFGTHTIGDLDDMFTDADPPENTNMTYEIVSFNTSQINALIDVDNNLIIESVQDAFGLSNLRVRATDNDSYVGRASKSTIADIQIDITPINDPPELFDLPEDILMASNDNYILNLSSNWSDVDDPNPVMTVTSPEGFVTVTKLEGYNYRFRINSSGLSDVSDYITVTLDDGNENGVVSEDILVTITASEPPYITFLIPNLEYLEDFALTEVVDLDQCFADPENDPLSYAVEVLTEVDEVDVITAELDEENIFWLESNIENWNGVAQVRVDCWDIAQRVVVSQYVDVYATPVNDLPVVGEIADVVLDEDFGSYEVIDLTELFTDVDDEVLHYQTWATPAGVVNPVIEDNYLSLNSIDDQYGITVVTVRARDNNNPIVWISTSFLVTVNNIYDYPTFRNTIYDGMELYVDLSGETFDLSQYIETYNENNVIPLGFQLVGDIPYYEVELTDGTLWSLDVYPIGHQWAYPNQDCVLMLESPSREGESVTVTFITNMSPYPTDELPDQLLNIDEGFSYDLDNYFADPQGYDLDYTVIYNADALVINQSGSLISTGAILNTDIGSVTIVASNGTRASCSQTFELITMNDVNFDLLVVDQDLSTSNLYQTVPEALDDCGIIDYDYYYYWNNPSGLTAEYLMDYDMILWFTGYNWSSNTTLSVTDEENLAAFVDNGGWLYLNSADYLWDKFVLSRDNKPELRQGPELALSDTTFAYNYLGLRYLIHDYWPGNADIPVFGNSGSFLANFWTILDYDGLWLYQDYLQEHVGIDLMSSELEDGTPGANAIMYGNTLFSTVPFFGYGTHDILVDYLSYVLSYYNEMTGGVGRGLSGNIEEDDDVVPAHTELLGNYPNPFNPETNIFFTLAEGSEVELTIYNIKGQMIRTLTEGTYGMGQHSVQWDGKDESGTAVTSGVYFYKITAGSYNSMKKMILLK
ncbi:MAG: hypothetical protein APR54_00035 [Candidatus Cloacimonas sp. SDB]|nr:MAG: hypothetical protein APR54_00035 [Candidatus Cloacimonas sp. SDB]